MVRNIASHKKARIREPFINALTLQAGNVLSQYLATPSGEAFMPSLPFPTAPGRHRRALFVWNCSARVDHTQTSMLRPSGRSFTTRGEQYRLRQSGKEPRSATPSSDVRYRKLSEFHASRRRPQAYFGRANAAFIRYMPCVVDKLRVERNDYFNAALLGILHNVYQRRSACCTGKQK